MDATYLLPVALGVSLAAATGFRVFIPLLITGLAMRGGFITQGQTMAWVATTPALFMLAVASAVEALAYYVPGVDNLLDALATPAAAAAGIAVSATVMTDLPPMLKWTLAIIAGGGAATMTQASTAVARAHSTAWTGGLGNHVIATGEIAGAILLSLLAIVFPYAALLMALLMILLIWRIFRWRRKPSDRAA